MQITIAEFFLLILHVLSSILEYAYCAVIQQFTIQILPVCVSLTVILLLSSLYSTVSSENICFKSVIYLLTYLHCTYTVDCGESFYTVTHKLREALHLVAYTYLSTMVTVQSPRSTRSSSVVTISRPPTSSSLKITNRSFQHTTPRLWNKLPHSFREPHPFWSFTFSKPYTDRIHTVISTSVTINHSFSFSL